ncbi:MAG: HAD-IA family hydrolase [Paracoccaceae bacterium]
MRTVVFDLDGTLADTSADLIEAANACFRMLGMGAPLDPAHDASVAFSGGRAMLREGYRRLRPGGWTEAEVDASYLPLLDFYRDGIDRQTRLYPGAERALRDLRDDGFALSICTNKPQSLAEELLRRLGVRDLFAALVGADTLPVRKPDPTPYREAVQRAGGVVGRSFLVGDTVTDRDTARAAGVPVVLVGFGPEGRDVARLGPDAMLDHYDGLPALARNLLA